MSQRKFRGFPAGADSITVLPDLFFTQLMPEIQDMAELKVTICIFYLLHHKQGYPCFVTYRELLSESALMVGMEEEELRHALNSAVNRGTILQLKLKIDGKQEDVYFANMESDRETIDKIRRGKFPVKDTKSREEGVGHAEQLPNIFLLYEQNIGIITPMIAEELKVAERLYPSKWIDEAFKEAVLMNKRSWKYISRILERWSSEGKDSGAYRQSNKKGSPDKYIRGKYGHLVRR